MAGETIDYEKFAREALRNVVRSALEEAIDGLPGEHHFYITVQTQAPGVEMSDGLRAAYPDEITVVMQHQYSNLLVEPERFSVTLYFNSTPERITVPYATISRFYDPSVPFGLIFDVNLTDQRIRTVDLDQKSEGRALETLELSLAEIEASAEAKPENTDESDTGNVVSLDQFRKK